MLREVEEGGTQDGKHAWKGDGDHFPRQSFGCKSGKQGLLSLVLGEFWGSFISVATLILHLPIIPIQSP